MIDARKLYDAGIAARLAMAELEPTASPADVESALRDALAERGLFIVPGIAIEHPGIRWTYCGWRGTETAERLCPPEDRETGTLLMLTTETYATWAEAAMAACEAVAT